MHILALDISRNAMGVCWGDAGSVPRFQTIPLGKDMETRDETCGRLLEWIVTWVNFPDQRPDWVFIEAPLEGGPTAMRNPTTTMLLTSLADVAAAACKVGRIPYRFVRVNSVRAHFIGKGNLPGDEGKRLVKQRCLQLGWEPKNYDESDAGAVWDYGCQKMAPRSQGVLDLQRARAL